MKQVIHLPVSSASFLMHLTHPENHVMMCSSKGKAATYHGFNETI